MTLVAALDQLPANLAACTPEDLHALNKAIFDGAEHDKDAVIRLYKVVDRMCITWVKRGGKIPKARRAKKDADAEAEEEGKEEEPKEEEPAKEIDPVKYHKELVALVGTVQLFDGLTPSQQKKTQSNLKLLVTPVDELKASRKAKKNDEVTVGPEVLDALRLIQKLKLGDAKGAKEPEKKAAEKKKRKRNRERKPRGERKEKKEDGEAAEAEGAEAPAEAAAEAEAEE